MCNHIIGYSEGAGYEAWLVYANNPNWMYEEIRFKFCPLCGKELMNEMSEVPS